MHATPPASVCHKMCNNWNKINIYSHILYSAVFQDACTCLYYDLAMLVSLLLFKIHIISLPVWFGSAIEIVVA